MEKDKIATLLHFAIKAGKLVYGVDNISAFHKKLHLIIICPTLSSNSENEIKNVCVKRNIPLLKPQDTLDKILIKPNCKAAALTDRQMAETILKNTNENYRLIKFAEETT